MKRIFKSRWLPRFSAAGCLRFALLWSRFFVVILLVASIEGLVIWYGGFQYRPPSAAHRVWTGPFSFDREGSLAAARLRVMRGKNQGDWSDVVLIDLHQPKIATIGARDWKPEVVALSPSGKAIAFSSGGGDVYAVTDCRDIVTDNAIARERPFASLENEDVTHLLFSPDGRLLAGVTHQSTSVWQWPGGKLLQRFPHDGDSINAVFFSPDSRHVIAPARAGHLSVYDARSGERVRDLSLALSYPLQIALDFARELVLLTDALRVYACRMDSAEVVWQKEFSGPVIGVDSQRNRLAITACENAGSAVAVYQLDNGQPICRLGSHPALVTGLSFAPNGTLYSWDLEGQFQSWDVDQCKKRGSLSLLEFQSQFQ